MASEVDICNLALARLGDSASVASIDPPEGSAQAEHCARFYPIARDSALESHAWSFALRRVVLAALSTDTWEWVYAYTLPTDVLRVLAVLPLAGASEAKTQPYSIEGDRVIRTNQEGASLRYVARITDTTLFSPLFTDAVGWLLASHLAGSIIKGDAGVQMSRSCFQNYMALLGQARASDSNQRSVPPTHTPGWIGRR